MSTCYRCESPIFESRFIKPLTDIDPKSEPPDSPDFRPRPRFGSGAIVAVALLTAVYGWLGFTSSSVTDYSVDALQISNGWADERSCVECHEQAETFHETGHARTLRAADSPRSLELLRSLQLDLSGDQSISVEQNVDGITAVNSTGNVQRRLKLDWCFGSGSHAHTWVSTLPDSQDSSELLEFHWTWFRDKQGFDITPGQSLRNGNGNSAVSAFGLMFDGPRAQRCFSCHTTKMQVKDGRIHEDSIMPGVTCQRCHGPRGMHVESGGEFRDLAWKPQDRAEAVGRCANCHRWPDEQEPHEINTTNIDIVRFQPVGLLQAKCYTESDMTCTTCHDPHRPMSRQDSKGLWQCLQCHSSDDSEHTRCAAGMSDRCLDCHMPPVKMEAALSFTDHWIRVREPSEPTP